MAVPVIIQLKKELGPDYSIKVIDLEKCLYRDFENGYNVEISGVNGGGKKNVSLYLWFGSSQFDCILVDKKHNVERSAPAIHEGVEELRERSELLISKGYTDRDSLFEMLYSELQKL